MKPRFIAVLSTYRLLYHGADLESGLNYRMCLQADGTYKTNIHGFVVLIVGKRTIHSMVS